MTPSYVPEWFRDGADAFQRISQSSIWGYVCPLCERLFVPELVSRLTKEHAPPEALGGSVICRTCEECNRVSGHELDAHLVGLDAGLTMLEGGAGGTFRARFHVEAGDLQATGRQIAPGRWEFTFNSGRNNPKVFEELPLSAGNSSPVTLIRPNHSDADRAAIALLRAAYLVSFAAFGYSYALHPLLEPVRQQISNPNVQILRDYLYVVHGREADWRFIGRVENPEWIKSILVEMGRYSVFLPDLSKDAPNLYHDLANHVQNHGLDMAEVEGAEFDWPLLPTYDLDWRPAV